MIDEALFARLAGFTSLTVLLAAPGTGFSAAVYPAGNVPQNAVLPYLTYQLISEPREHAMGADPGIRQPRFQVSVWATGSTEARDIAVQVEAALSRFHGTVAGVLIQDVLKENETDLGRDATTLDYQRALDFVVWHE